MPSLRYNASEFALFFAPLLSTPQHVLITAHQDPDIDAIGSCLAMAHTLTDRGHTCSVWLADPLPQIAQFLPGSDLIVSRFPEWTPSLTVILDCANFERIRGHDDLAALHATHPDMLVVSIDHHGDNPQLYGHNWVWESASSTGEMLCHLFQALNISVSAASATCLYAAIAFDTGRFLYSNVTPFTFRTAAWLLEQGARHSDISIYMFESYTEADFLVMTTALANRVVHPKGLYAYTVFPASIPQAGLRGIDVIRSLSGVNVFASFSETETGEVKVNLRAKTDFNVQEVAALFNGGGHKKAAGISWKGPLDEIKTKVLQVLDERLSRR